VTRCEIFRRLHHSPPTLLLPNCWDAASARIFEVAGFPAIATSSAAIAFALGYSDGQRLDVDAHFNAIANIVATVDVPVTVDLESGYAADTIGLTKNVRRLALLGVAGYNLEDSSGKGVLYSIEDQCARITAAKDAAPDVFLNARTDILLDGIGDPSTALERSIERLDAYLHAGADGIFVPGISDPETIATIARRFPKRPLNVLAGPKTPSTIEMQGLGVARISVGSWPMRRAMGLLRDIARELRRDGTFNFTRDPVISYDDANALFNR
jgi:2-methylisocitrate lyase-like PEP mutase family enzyme